MAYVTGNPKSKAELRRRIAAGEAFKVFQPGPFGPEPTAAPNHTVPIEGPHFPEPHRWWGIATLNASGTIASVK